MEPVRIQDTMMNYPVIAETTYNISSQHPRNFFKEKMSKEAK
jgi:hypothetical protein